MKGFKRKVISLSVLGFLAAMSSEANAAGYKLEFQSASVLADAGEAAVVEDAGTNWYNSAGLVYLPQQIVASMIGVMQRTQFSGASTAPFPPPPGASPLSPFNYNVTNSHASSYPSNLLPAFHYVLPFKDRYAFGISVVPAWGLMEDYGEKSDVRYSINHISTKTTDVSPSLAMKINDKWSVGAGADIHYFAIQNRFQVLNPISGDAVSRYSANNWGLGWHAGVLYRVSDATRIGLNYRSKIVMNLDGDSDFTGGFATNNFKVNIPLPPTTSLSVYHDVTPVWALMGTIAYDQWSVIQYYYGQNLATPFGPTNAVLPQNFNNTFDFSIGTHYTLNAQWMLRGSLKYVATPTVNSSRTLSFPDGDKYGINLGARYQVNKKVAVDMIIAHVFTKSAHINDINPLTGATSVGHTNTDINLAGAQLVWDI